MKVLLVPGGNFLVVDGDALLTTSVDLVGLSDGRLIRVGLGEAVSILLTAGPVLVTKGGLSVRKGITGRFSKVPSMTSIPSSSFGILSKIDGVGRMGLREGRKTSSPATASGTGWGRPITSFRSRGGCWIGGKRLGGDDGVGNDTLGGVEGWLLPLGGRKLPCGPSVVGLPMGEVGGLLKCLAGVDVGLLKGGVCLLNGGLCEGCGLWLSSMIKRVSGNLAWFSASICEGVG